MKVLKILGIIILILAALVLGLVIFGPSSGHLERQITINAPADAVFADVSNMKSFNKWSPWFQVDPDAEYVWEGPPSGEGAKITWYSENPDLGNGYMLITEARPGEFVNMDMGFDQNGNKDFTDEGEEKPTASFILEEEGDNTNVTWTFDISGVSGLEKMMVVGLDMMLGPFYEQGLNALKERVENRPSLTAKISVEEVVSIVFAGKEATTANDPEEISRVMSDTYFAIMEALVKNGITMSEEGYPLAIATAYDESSLSMICGVPVPDDASMEEGGDVSLMNSPEGTAVRAIHYGDYALLEGTHNQISEYADFYGYEISGNPWEVYITDPSVETDTAKWVTEVYYPVK